MAFAGATVGVPVTVYVPHIAAPSKVERIRALGAAVEFHGQDSGGIYQFSIPRALPVTEQGMALPPPMGSAIGINFQPTGFNTAAITGDFVLTAQEVNPVIGALKDAGIEVTALHSHMLQEEPRLFFMHFWANGDTLKLAHGLRTALDKIDIRQEVAQGK